MKIYTSSQCTHKVTTKSARISTTHVAPIRRLKNNHAQLFLCGKRGPTTDPAVPYTTTRPGARTAPRGRSATASPVTPRNPGKIARSWMLYLFKGKPPYPPPKIKTNRRGSGARWRSRGACRFLRGLASPSEGAFMCSVRTGPLSGTSGWISLVTRRSTLMSLWWTARAR